LKSPVLTAPFAPGGAISAMCGQGIGPLTSALLGKRKAIMPVLPPPAYGDIRGGRLKNASLSILLDAGEGSGLRSRPAVGPSLPGILLKGG
jgi:hypothetical protein